MKFLVIYILISINIHAQALLPPPFGLQWGDTPDKVLDWAEELKLDVKVDIPGHRPEIRIISVSSATGTLPQHQAHTMETRYQWGKLFEVSLHYGNENDNPEDIKSLFTKLKTALSLKHGSFQPSSKKDEQINGYSHKLISYHVEPVSGLLLLIAHTEVQDIVRNKKSARLSLIYSNNNIKSN